jgi:hypothetical protein
VIRKQVDSVLGGQSRPVAREPHYHGRYLVITVTRSTAPLTGTVFDSPDGMRFVVTPSKTRQEADAARATAGPEATILAVRPSWSFPASEWIAAESAILAIEPSRHASLSRAA